MRRDIEDLIETGLRVGGKHVLGQLDGVLLWATPLRALLGNVVALRTTDRKHTNLNYFDVSVFVTLRRSSSYRHCPALLTDPERHKWKKPYL